MKIFWIYWVKNLLLKLVSSVSFYVNVLTEDSEFDFHPTPTGQHCHRPRSFILGCCVQKKASTLGEAVWIYSIGILSFNPKFLT